MDGSSFWASFAAVSKTNQISGSEINLSILLFLRPSLAYHAFDRLRYRVILIDIMIHRSWARFAL